MTAAVPTAHEDSTMGEIHESLKKKGSNFKTINYIYVLDNRKHLVGVLSVRDVFMHPFSKKAKDVAKKSSLIYLHPEASQERAAYLALQHNIKAIPVIDKDHLFLGEITADSILTILHKEMHEDTLRRAGIGHAADMKSAIFTLPIHTSIRHRIPWLILGLLGGLLAAKVVGFFEEILSTNLVLAAFIPLIVYMSDAVGTQMEAYIIRDLAVEGSIPFGKYLARHLLVVFCIATIIAALLMVSYSILTGQIHLAAVLSIALFIAILSSVCTGLIIPYTLSKFGVDPADSSGPVATIIQDILSIVIYFSIAQLLL